MNTNSPADYYAAKERDARAFADALRTAIEQGAPAEEIAELERRLEAARYVGD